MHRIKSSSVPCYGSSMAAQSSFKRVVKKPQAAAFSMCGHALKSVFLLLSSCCWILKAQNLATTPLLLALSALGLLLVGAVLGGACVHLVSARGPHMRDALDAPSPRSPPMPKAMATVAETEPRAANKGRFLPGQAQPRTASLESIIEHYRTDKSKDPSAITIL